jgi:hypothetical protein
LQLFQVPWKFRCYTEFLLRLRLAQTLDRWRANRGANELTK